MSETRRLDRIERELDRRRPVNGEPDMSAEDVAVAQRIIEPHYQRFGPPPAEDDASIVRWLASRSRVGSDNAIN